MRETRTSGSVGAWRGDPSGYPTQLGRRLVSLTCASVARLDTDRKLSRDFGRDQRRQP